MNTAELRERIATLADQVGTAIPNLEAGAPLPNGTYLRIRTRAESTTLMVSPRLWDFPPPVRDGLLATTLALHGLFTRPRWFRLSQRPGARTLELFLLAALAAVVQFLFSPVVTLGVTLLIVLFFIGVSIALSSKRTYEADQIAAGAIGQGVVLEFLDYFAAHPESPGGVAGLLAKAFPGYPRRARRLRAAFPD